MARFEDLHLDPDEGPGPSQTRHAEEARAFLDALSDLLADRRYNFANETLSGIWDSVEGTLRVTEGQRQAVANIRRSVEEREDKPRGGSRRYEGWSR